MLSIQAELNINVRITILWGLEQLAKSVIFETRESGTGSPVDILKEEESTIC